MNRVGQFETIKVGRAKIEMDVFGTVRFRDHKGHLRRADGDPVVLALIETIRKGNGKPHEPITVQPNEPNRNVETKRYGPFKERSYAPDKVATASRHR